MLIKNKLYTRFLKEGIIETIGEEDIIKALDKIQGRHKIEARALLICLYYTGARPNEVLRLVGRDLIKKGSYLLVKIKGSKGGLPRTLHLPLRLPLIKELYKYALSMHEDAYIFFNYKGAVKKVIMTRNGPKEYQEISGRLRYHFSKWFDGVTEEPIPPYYLRHNRLSKLSEAGLTMQDLQMFKGSKSINSVMPYLHMSRATAKKIARRID